ncbi:uncharacterized protein LOC108219718 isoform X3 [Daucus carota subsp. sativus]|uniref:uncharacterized protein LOC108219718 isoform X3 n=1 Tax=Daucus carota subsp. sativus TaxID=79200 RepID=UPI0030832983
MKHQVFFCKYNDPIYVNMEKLLIMIKLPGFIGVQKYVTEVDVDFGSLILLEKIEQVVSAFLWVLCPLSHSSAAEQWHSPIHVSMSGTFIVFIFICISQAMDSGRKRIPLGAFSPSPARTGQ